MNNYTQGGNPTDNKRGDYLVEMYVKLILEGKRFFAEVPEIIMDEIRQILIEIGREDLIEL